MSFNKLNQWFSIFSSHDIPLTRDTISFCTIDKVHHTPNGREAHTLCGIPVENHRSRCSFFWCCSPDMSSPSHTSNLSWWRLTWRSLTSNCLHLFLEKQVAPCFSRYTFIPCWTIKLTLAPLFKAAGVARLLWQACWDLTITHLNRWHKKGLAQNMVIQIEHHLSVLLKKTCRTGLF